MASEELLERSEVRDMQRERERERRRMRDRQRRQSMSVEEKENHLARRRRNYQLRRQRVGTAQSDSQPEQTSISSLGEKITAIRNQAEVPISDVSVHCETAAKQGNGQIIVEGPRYEVGVEANTCKLDELPKRLRLNHIRHLARSLNNPIGGLIGGNDRIGSDVIMKENESAHYQPPKILRLTSVKRLARALNSITKQTSGHNPQCGMEEGQNVPRSKIQLICNEMSNYAQPVNLNVEDEQMSADG